MAGTMHTLVTFLGKGRDNPQTGYRSTIYVFPDGSERNTAFFSLALAEFLQPDELVILGTSGSMWGVLVENLVAEEGEEALRLELIDAEAKAQVSEDLLMRVTPLLSKAVGRNVVPRLIPFGKTLDEQQQILSVIAKTLNPGEVSFDLTHGFRHLGMLGLISAFMLQNSHRLTLKGLWYGALDMTTANRTPVIRLDGLNRIQLWVEALSRYDATGDYGVFAPLLKADGVDVALTRNLEEAAFFERTFNVREARRKLLTFLPVLEQPLPGPSRLFQKKLRERLQWVRSDSLHEHQRRLACAFFQRGDYVRAAVFAWEAVISKKCAELGLDPNDFEHDRKEAEKAIKQSVENEGKRWSDSAPYRIKQIRNALAHGTIAADKRMRKVLTDPEEFSKALEADIKRALK